MHVHQYAGPKARQDLLVDEQHVALRPDDMGGVDEQDVVLLQASQTAPAHRSTGSRITRTPRFSSQDRSYGSMQICSQESAGLWRRFSRMAASAATVE